MTNFAWIYLFSWLAVISIGIWIIYRFSKRWSQRHSGRNSAGEDDPEKDQPSPLRIWLGNRWAAQHLAVEAPAGEHTYTFRYLPWDVLLGFLLTLIGVGLATYIAKIYRVSKPIGVQNETDS